MTKRVPDNETFNLEDVHEAVKDHAPNTQPDLANCFDESEEGFFNPTYRNVGYAPWNSMKQFRDYGGVYCYVQNQDYVTSSFDTDALNRGVFFAPAGATMFILYHNNTLKRYNLATAWDVSTASHHSTLQLNAGDGYAEYTGLFFRENGFSFYTINRTKQRIERWFMTLPFFISTAIYSASAADSLPFSSIGNAVPHDIEFDPSGKRLFFVDNSIFDAGNNTRIVEYDLATAWDLSSVTLNWWIRVLGRPLMGLSFMDDGKNLLVLSETMWESIIHIKLSISYELFSFVWSCSSTLMVNASPTGLYVRDRMEADKQIDMFVTNQNINKVSRITSTRKAIREGTPPILP